MTDRYDGTTTDASDRSVAGPLSGVKMLDLTQMLAGPYAGMLFADLGADVIKVESPRGDMTRTYPPRHDGDDDYGGYFQSVNRNKRSVVLDLKTEEGTAAFEELVTDADVLLENFRVGTMDRFGLSYEQLRDVNPQLVYASIRGFGDPRTGESPYAERPAFDLIAQAIGGVMGITGTEESGPTKVGPGVGDLFPAVLSAFGILAALHERERTGEGQFVDVGMVDAVLSMTERIVYQYSYDGDVPAPQGTTHPMIFPYDRFEVADGYVVIAAPTNRQWRKLCEHMGKPELGERYETESDRHEHADELQEHIDAWLSTKTKDEVFEILGEDVPCGPVNTVEDIFEDEHFQRREMLPAVEHGDSGEEVQVAGTPVKFSGGAPGVERRAPRLGEHTREVLAEHGLGDADIDSVLDASRPSGED